MCNHVRQRYGRGTVEFSFSTGPLPYLYRTSTSTCIVALQYTPTICSIIKHYEAMPWAKGLEVWRLQFRSCGRYGRYPNLSINQYKIYINLPISKHLLESYRMTASEKSLLASRLHPQLRRRMEVEFWNLQSPLLRDSSCCSDKM